VTLGLIALAAVVLVPLATAGHQPKCPVLNVRCLRPATLDGGRTSGQCQRGGAIGQPTAWAAARIRSS
jgi:hypothetical protein